MRIPFLLLVALGCAAAQNPSAIANQRLFERVTHQLERLPYLTIFDSVSFRLDGDTVVLEGAVTDPVMRRDAENLVKRVEGVEQVVDQMKVLLPNPFDQQIRWEVYLALVRQPTLQVYFLQVLCPIRIVVDDGNVTLEGLVSDQADADLARLAAGAVPGMLSFKSNLQTVR